MIIKLAPGIYTEKVTVDVGRPFVTLLGQPGSQTVLTYHGTAAQYGTVESATLIVWSDYFMAANLIIKVRKKYIYIYIYTFDLRMLLHYIKDYLLY